jgi:ADP-ribosylglycohydrolase
MLGAIAGDVIGSVYERRRTKSTEFPLFHGESTFTDDTVLTVAVAHAILHGQDYGESIRDFGQRYPGAGYGASFYQWLHASDPEPYGSWGNGSAMRVSPVGFAYNDEADVLREARRCAEVTHNHPEGIKGAQATALAVLLARQRSPKERIREELGARFGYALSRSLDAIRPGYGFDVSCQGSVPESIIAFLESTDWEDAVRNAISLGGDSDTMACIAGAIAEAFYGSVPPEIARTVRSRLPDDLLDVVHAFAERYGTACTGRDA